MARVRRNTVEVVRLAGGYPLGQIERLIRDLGPLLRATEPVTFDLDLSGLAGVGPTSLAVLTATVNRLRSLNLIKGSCVIQPPKSRSVRTYLLRMDAFEHMVGADFHDAVQRHEPVGFRPCMHFINEADHQTVVRHLALAMEESVHTDEVGRWSLASCLSELCENVLHHAESPAGGFAAAQTYAKKRQEVEVSIVDLGRGIRESLTKNALYADIDDDVRAIETAMQQGVTTTPERNAGLGLFVTRHLLRANGGRLVIRSGVGGVYDGVEESCVEHPHPFPGTLVTLVARTDNAFDMGHVYTNLGFEVE